MVAKGDDPGVSFWGKQKAYFQRQNSQFGGVIRHLTWKPGKLTKPNNAKSQIGHKFHQKKTQNKAQQKTTKKKDLMNSGMFSICSLPKIFQGVRGVLLWLSKFGSNKIIRKPPLPCLWFGFHRYLSGRWGLVLGI